MLQEQQQHPQPTIDVHAGGSPYDTKRKDSFQAFQEACAALPQTYDGTNEKYPAFIVALKQKTMHCFWNDPTTGIITIAGKNLFDDIRTITETELQTARAARTDPRAQQNSIALYETIRKSLTGDAFTSFFSQDGNLPTDKDGPLMFKAIQGFTTVQTVSSAVEVTDELSNFDPAKYKFNITVINQELSGLFLRAMQSPMGCTDQLQIAYILRTYRKIKRPAEWTHFVTQMESQQQSNPPTITDPRILMNMAGARYRELKNFTEEYGPSLMSLEEHVVVMMAEAKKEAAANKKAKTKTPEKEGTPKKPKGGADLPPFATHTKTTLGDGGRPYKEDETKTWNGQTYHFHLAPTHAKRRRWFVGAGSVCQTCNKWKNAKDDGTKSTDATSALSDLTPDDSQAPGGAAEVPSFNALISSALAKTEDEAVKILLGEILDMSSNN